MTIHNHDQLTYHQWQVKIPWNESPPSGEAAKLTAVGDSAMVIYIMVKVLLGLNDGYIYDNG